MRWRGLGLLVIGVCSMTACDDASEPGGADPTISNETIPVELTTSEIARPDRPLDETTWWVESTRGVAGTQSPTQAASLQFASGVVLIDSGCNLASTLVLRPTETSLQIDPIQFTDAPCDEPTASIERAVIGALNDGEVTVEIHGDVLRLVGSAGEIELRAGDPAPADPLDAQLFVDDAVDGRELVPGTEVRLRFDHSAIHAGAGCNSMSGRYRITGNVLVVGDLSSTEMACDDAALHEQDEWFARLLSSMPTVTIDGSSLTLTGHDATVTFVGTPFEPAAPPADGAPPPTTGWSLAPPSTGG